MPEMDVEEFRRKVRQLTRGKIAPRKIEVSQETVKYPEEETPVTVFYVRVANGRAKEVGLPSSMRATDPRELLRMIEERLHAEPPVI